MSGGNMSGRQILVIDDEASIRANVLRVLRMEGFEVREAENGVAGLASIRAQRPDLILCDLMMPEKDGGAVLAELRADHSTAAIPFIFLTASVSPEDLSVGRVPHADGYLIKPFRLADLLSLVARHLAPREESQSA